MKNIHSEPPYFFKEDVFCLHTHTHTHTHTLSPTEREREREREGEWPKCVVLPELQKRKILRFKTCLIVHHVMKFKFVYYT